ncbi:hypothetical protein TNCT_32161 [Trichonephila clavata]|uniref:Uncharacterized protein n=1 Tax=Trichonephila clavata TaxID=2740835 RepID=A0A8X6HCW4_TRICU|nr:hypothetical protein TNCT_32161 [Trichonephila clavata]
MSSIKALNRKRGNILAQLTKLSSKTLDNLSEFELSTLLDTLHDKQEKFEDIKQAYFEINNDVEPILNKIDEDIQEFQVSGKLLLYKCTVKLINLKKLITVQSMQIMFGFLKSCYHSSMNNLAIGLHLKVNFII